MDRSLVLTVIGADRPGLVESLARVLAAHDANWEAAHMAQLEGHFAGILLVRLASAQVEPTVAALNAIHGLRVFTEASGPAPEAAFRALRLELVGNDHPGIVREITQVLTERSINVAELESRVSGAPMAGGSLFRMRALLQAPADLDILEIQDALELLAADLVVDIQLHRDE